MTTYHQRTVAILVIPEGESVYAETATRIEISDEGDGEFLIVTQDKGEIRIDPTEWHAIREGIDAMIGKCGDP